MATSNIRRITTGPCALNIIMDVFHRLGNSHSYFKFEGQDKGGKWPITVNSVSTNREADEDEVIITGFVMLNHRNRYQYHYFTANYNVRTRTGQATFEVTCRKCHAEVNEYGVCTVCDPCDRCNRKECNPHRSCCEVQPLLKGLPVDPEQIGCLAINFVGHFSLTNNS